MWEGSFKEFCKWAYHDYHVLNHFDKGGGKKKGAIYPNKGGGSLCLRRKTSREREKRKED